jgi:hypothetical protein
MYWQQEQFSLGNLLIKLNIRIISAFIGICGLKTLVLRF